MTSVTVDPPPVQLAAISGRRKHIIDGIIDFSGGIAGEFTDLMLQWISRFYSNGTHRFMLKIGVIHMPQPCTLLYIFI